jgi:hypothetical protein
MLSLVQIRVRALLTHPGPYTCTPGGGIKACDLRAAYKDRFFTELRGDLGPKSFSVEDVMLSVPDVEW